MAKAKPRDPLTRYHRLAERLGIKLETPESLPEALDRIAKRRKSNR